MSKSFPLYDVTINRGREVIACAVPEHEARVIAVAHGPSHVRVLGPSGDTIALEPSADAEFARLQRRYRRLNAPDPVGQTFPLGPSALEAFGFDGRGEVKQAPGSMVKKHKPAEKPADEKPAKAAK